MIRMNPPTPRRPKTRGSQPVTAPTSATVAELRALARELGIRGYSRMRRDELERELAARGRMPGPVAAAPAAPAPATPASFREDIDRLPEPREPRLGLLPQRPGVVQAYWVLPPELTRSLPPLHLRLMRADVADAPPVAERPVATGSGHQYFHFADDIDPGVVYLQLGYYDSSHRFVNAIGERLVRVPSLYAARHDPRTGSDTRFRALYLGSGGAEPGGRLGWSGLSTSSPAAPFAAPSSPPFHR
jgi:hypothetical protein